MGYDREFYVQYNRYLHEYAVRKSHDWIINIIKLNSSFNDVIDLGCGEFNEFLVFGKPDRYFGLDTNQGNYAYNDIEDNIVTRARDYRNINFADELWDRKSPTAFVSLFSTEITDSLENNYKFYEKIFKELPLESGIVSGFYYINKKDQNPVVESCDLVSFQTLENIEDVPKSDYFKEKARIIIPTPSNLFGDDVVEVWKLFERRN